VPGDSPSREGGFTSTPRAGALSPVWGLPGSPGLRTLRGPKSPISPNSGKIPKKGPKRALPATPARNPEKWGTGPLPEGPGLLRLGAGVPLKGGRGSPPGE